MGGRAGGGARSGGGGAGGGRDLFTGGFKENMGPTGSIFIDSIGRQTEKAIQVSTAVSWAKGGARPKDIWVPKSQVVRITKNKELVISKDMARKISLSNSFKGYPMEFVNSYGV